MQTLILILAIIIMLAGLLGTLLPIIPGLPLIWLATLGFGFYSGWAEYSWGLVTVTGLIALASLIIDQAATAIGAKKFGAGRAGMIGSIVGAIIGMLFFFLPGLIIGTFAGAMLFEMVFNGKNLSQGLSAGTGAFLGFLAGSFFKFTLGCLMVFLFLGSYFHLL